VPAYKRYLLAVCLWKDYLLRFACKAEETKTWVVELSTSIPDISGK